jgi:hypothetical protein
VHRIVTAIRRNAVAWLALSVALGGTGIAASQYVITSTTQIKPSALRQLRHRLLHGYVITSNKQIEPSILSFLKEPSAATQKSAATGTTHYIITSTKQIKPSVLTALKGKTGADGSPGPAGPTGPQGPPGNGAGYTAQLSTPQPLTDKPTVLLTKEVPAGSYIVATQAQIVVTGATAAVGAAATCELLDSPGPVFETSSVKLGVGTWSAQLAENASHEYEGASTVSISAALSSEAERTISLVCEETAPHGSGAQMSAQSATITALQTSKNE